MTCEYDIFSNRPLDRFQDMLKPLKVATDSSEKWWSMARRAKVVINWFIPVTREMLKDPGCVELIIARSTGYDHIDVEAAEKRGICVANQPEVINEAVAEYTVAALITALKRINEAERYFPEWHKEGWPRHIRGFLLMGRTIGLLGAGHIAHSVVEKLLPFYPARILYYSRTPKPMLEALPNARKVGLEELFKESDIVINTLPLSNETKGIVTSDLLKMMPRNAVYVNVGRGATEEPEAVVEARRERPDITLVLDVHPEEPVSPSNPRYKLYGKLRTLLTPHVAGYSDESLKATTILAIMQARSYLEKGCVWNPVNRACRRCPGKPVTLIDAISLARQISSKERRTLYR